MRIVTVKKLLEYSKVHKDAKIPLLHWYEVTRQANWENFTDIKSSFNSVDYVGNNRYVFNIKGNDYRLVVIIIFISKKVYIRFIGTHNDYDYVDASKI